jgi:predicted NBD/HSP70 family sugar kinase
LRAAIVNSYGTVLERRVQPTPKSAECPDAVVEVTDSLLKRHRTAKAGMGVPGRVSFTTGQLEYAPNPPANWAQWISDHRLTEVLGVNVSLANDAFTPALGDDARLACASEWGEAFGRRSSTGLGWIGRWKSEAVL